MTATISIQPTPVDAAFPTDRTAKQREELSFGAFQARTMPVAILLTFALFAGGMYIFRGDALGAIGLGAFMSFWLGGGFGFLVGGVLYGLQEEAHS